MSQQSRNVITKYGCYIHSAHHLCAYYHLLLVCCVFCNRKIGIQTQYQLKQNVYNTLAQQLSFLVFAPLDASISTARFFDIASWWPKRLALRHEHMAYMYIPSPTRWYPNTHNDGNPPSIKLVCIYGELVKDVASVYLICVACCRDQRSNQRLANEVCAFSV